MNNQFCISTVKLKLHVSSLVLYSLNLNRLLAKHWKVNLSRVPKMHITGWVMKLFLIIYDGPKQLVELPRMGRRVFWENGISPSDTTKRSYFVISALCMMIETSSES